MAKAKTANDKITIHCDGTYTPSGGVSINPGGIVQFEVEFCPNTNTCYIPFGKITFKQVARTPKTGSGTIKVGSGGSSSKKRRK
jgi:hypothetical protein